MMKLAARAGIIGPVLFGIVIFVLTIVEYDFMLTLGWHPRDPLDWPSGLALGPLGWLMTLTFLLSGLMMTFFAYGLRLGLPRSRWTSLAIWLIALAGLAMVGLTFTTDPTLRSTPKTWHGFLHDASFMLLGFTMLPAMILLGFVFREDRHWENLAWYTWVTAALAVPTFWLKGAAFYVFLLAELIWWEVVSLRLNRKVAQSAPP